MMPSAMGAPLPDSASHIYPTGHMFDDYSRQMAYDSARRMSHHRPTNSMRVVKPTSASNSPQAMMMRRRTMMNDGNLARRRQEAFDQLLLQQLQGVPSPYANFQEPMKRASRPVSWHPSTMPQPQMSMYQTPAYDYTQYAAPTPTPYSDADMYQAYQQFPPTPAAYSGQTSPLSAFSPLSLSYAAAIPPQPMPQYVSTDAWNPPKNFAQTPYSAGASPDTEPFPTFPEQTGFNWDTLANTNYNSCTAPPTPDNFQPAAQPDPVVPSEETIPYQSLEEPEEEGEILVGMGLYDRPAKAASDPGLDNYRTTTSHLLGSTYRRGAGLKLEEAWQPPKEFIEKDDDDEEDEEDADGDEQKDEYRQP